MVQHTVDEVCQAMDENDYDIMAGEEEEPRDSLILLDIAQVIAAMYREERGHTNV